MKHHLETEKLLNVSEVCELTGLAQSTIYNGLHLGRGPLADLPVVRLGRQIRFRMSDVLDYLEAHTHRRHTVLP